MAQWSNVWSNKNIPGRMREAALKGLRFTPPSPAKASKKGKYPHKQKAGAI